MTRFYTYLPIALGAGFLFFGVQKFGADNAIFEIIAQRSGLSIFEPGIRLLTGFAEILAGVLLLVPATRRPASLLGLAILFGAIGFHLSPWLGINVPGIGHGLFFTAVIMTALNLALVRNNFGRASNPHLA